MEPVVVIPTFWTRRRSGRGRSTVDEVSAIYDHPTPINEESTLASCLQSLRNVRGLGRVLVIVAVTDESIAHQAEDRVREIVDEFPDIDAFVFGPAEMGSLHRRLEQLEFADMIEGVTLMGYGAVRNVGLIAAAVLGHDSVLFIDDDEIVRDADFMERALYGVGQTLQDGTPLLAKSGFYVDEQGQWQHSEPVRLSDMFWRQRDAFNAGLGVMMKPPRIQRARLAFGGCLILHRDMYTAVSFDPWVTRGEDMDYVINVRMHGGDVFFDDEWRVVHLPPEQVSEALRFRQDVYRFVYEHRKIEFAKSQVDLRQVTPKSMAPYPGDFIDSSVGWRAWATGMLRAIMRPEKALYFKAANHAVRDASEFAREHCQHYFEFQRRWPLMMERIWDDVALSSLFTGERRVDRTAITGRFPVVPPAE
ncbi:MAG TPA: glycosyltransferase [Coriobacteriia bacterium]|nr:glycosyltransferase [Coriobacteriia bacterium]